MGQLVAQVRETIRESRENAARLSEHVFDRQATTDEQLVSLAAWLQGIENALCEVALQVEQLISRPQGEPATDKND